MSHLLELRDLCIRTPDRVLVEKVDVDVFQGEITAVMGPSGAGKSLTARACMGVLDVEPGLSAGSLRFPAHSDRDWFKEVRGARAQRKLLKETRVMRGAYVTYSPQAASSALNPGRTIGQQLALAVARREGGCSDVAAAVRACLEDVGLPLSASGGLPRELSGGMNQRAALAIAVAPLPKVLIADEPETGLDPVLTRQIIELMISVAKDKGCGMLLISHHQDTVDRVADRVVHLPGRGHA
jgi:ABC-type glutathione transport system ATPase component